MAAAPCFVLFPQRFVGFDIPAGGARKLDLPPPPEVDGQEISSICKLKGELVLNPSAKALAAPAAFDARLFSALLR